MGFNWDNRFQMGNMNIKTFLDYKVILANQPQPVCFAIHFEAPVVAKPRPTPVAFCLVLDRSGSMQGQPLAKAKQAALLAVRHLRPEDYFSLVVFDDKAQVLIPLQAARDKESFARIIEGINPGASTNLTGGWSLGRDELKQAPAGCSRRLLLLSDGQLNHGIVEPEAVRRIVASGLENQQIRTSCLGFGSGYNEDLMTALAQVTNGQFYDADSPEKFPAIFESELQGLQKLAVQNLRVRLEKLEFCEALEPLGNSPAVTLPGGRVEFTVGDLVSSETRLLCFQLAVLPLPWVNGQPVASLEGERLLQVECLWDELGAEAIVSKTWSQTVRIQATQDPAAVRQEAEVIPWVALQKAGQTIDGVTKHMDSGNVEAAVAMLRRSIEFLQKYGPAEKVQEAVQQLQHLLLQVETGSLSLRERKMSKFRSHSYRKMSSHEYWSSDEQAPSFKHRPPPPTPPGPNPSQPGQGNPP
jgi:Ca-activated chloride channel family protein